MNGRQLGTIHNFHTGQWLCDVEFVLWRLSGSEASGRIWIEGDPHPATQFLGQGDEAPQRLFLVTPDWKQA